MLPRAAILGTGHFVPDNVVTNAMLIDKMGVNETVRDPSLGDWIEQRTGIRERRHVDFKNAPMDGVELGIRASRQALDMARVRPEEIDFVIWGTLSPDHQFPGNACWAQPRLGVRAGVPCMDIRNQCSFFVYALAMAEALIAAGKYRRILVCGSEIQSTGVEFNERGKDVAILFGDGAGAVVVGPATEPNQGILATDLHADGSYADRLQISFGSGQEHVYITKDQLDRGEHYPKMNGKSVFKNAVTKMPETIETTLKQANITLADVALIICHQANLRIVEYVQRSLEVPAEKFYNNIQRYGNTTAASIPIALDECVRSGRLQRGELVCVAAFGAGFTWGSALIRF